MKSTLLVSLLALFIACQAIEEIDEIDDWKWATLLDSSSLWNAPSFNNSVCVSTSSNSTSNTTVFSDQYKAWSFLLSEDSFIRAFGLLTTDLASQGSLFIYNSTFNVSAPCANLFLSVTEGQLDNAKSFNGLNFEIAGWLQAGTYWFVFSLPATFNTTSNSTVPLPTQEYVVLNIEEAHISGSINDSSFATWKLPEILGENFEGNATCTVNATTTDTPKIFIGTFTLESDDEYLSANNQYDILVYLQNSETSLLLDQPIVALYKGDLSSFTKTNNSQNATTPLLLIDPCESFANFTLLSIIQGNKNDLTTRLTATLLVGQIYSVVVSGTHPEDTGIVGIFVVPSVIGDVSDQELVNQTFSVPSVLTFEVNGTTQSNCTDTGVLSTTFDVYRFTAESEIYIVNAFSKNFQPFIVVYDGFVNFTDSNLNVTANSTSSNSSSCDNLLISGNTNETGPIVLNNLVLGNNYTIVVTPKVDTTDLLSGKYYFYLLSGEEEESHGTVTGLSQGTDQGLKTDELVEVNSAVRHGLNIGVALIALLLMVIVF